MGYGIAAAIGVLVVVLLILATGRFEAAAGLKVLAGAGAIGAILGHQVTLRRRRARGIRGPLDDWKRFLTSWTGFAIGMIVIFGSFVLAILILVVRNALSGTGA